MAVVAPILMAVTAVAGLAMSAYGMVRQSQATAAAGEAANNQAKTQASLYAYNSGIASVNATEAQTSADTEIYLQQKKAKSLLATQRAAYAKAGVDMAGSPLDVQNDTLTQAEFDRLTLEHEGEMNVWKAKNQAAALDTTGSATLASGDYAESAASYGSGTTLLTGVGSLLTSSSAMWKNKVYPSNSITVTKKAGDIASAGSDD